MALDESQILREFPFNRLDLPDDETVILTDANPTFHRPELQAVLISNQALYLGEAWQDRAVKWRRFLLTEITCVTLTTWKYSVTELLATGLCLFAFTTLCLFALAQWGITELGVYLLFYGVPILAIIAWGIWKGSRSQQATCALRIEMDTESYTWRMVGDDYAEEKSDCLMLRSAWDKLAELGVKTATDL
jgi:hypothetical protein